MKNLLMLLALANVLYFMWEQYVEDAIPAGVVVVHESALGPPLDVSKSTMAEAGVSVGALPGTGTPSELAASRGPSCVTVGPLKTAADAERAQADFEAEGMRASVRATVGQVFVGHWVQIRDIPDRSTGNAMLEKLREGGLSDAYLVPTEDEGLKISLGLFGEKTRAEKVELDARSMDFDAEITPRVRDATVYFVDAALSPGKGAGPMIEQYGEENVRLRDKATCPRSN